MKYDNPEDRNSCGVTLDEQVRVKPPIYREEWEREMERAERAQAKKDRGGEESDTPSLPSGSSYPPSECGDETPGDTEIGDAVSGDTDEKKRRPSWASSSEGSEYKRVGGNPTGGTAYPRSSGYEVYKDTCYGNWDCGADFYYRYAAMFVPLPPLSLRPALQRQQVLRVCVCKHIAVCMRALTHTLPMRVKIPARIQLPTRTRTHTRTTNQAASGGNEVIDTHTPHTHR
eukprot:GDKI01037096.1.p1 GENE.GDKI01037096.1~~GDKI01037096.1.p1  ORF type:complete len:262 (+),score=81.53 GDKI01037096.1:100-786(+)